MHVLLGLAARQHGVVTLTEALAIGVTRAMLRTAVRNGVLLRVARGVFVVAGSPATWRQKMLVAIRASGEGSVACLSSAARLHGIRTERRSKIEIVIPPGRSGARLADLVHHTDYLPPHHTVIVDSILTTSPARTIMDICGRKPYARSPHLDLPKRLVNDALLAGVTTHALRTVAAECSVRGRNGCGVLRDVMSALAPSYVPTESELEDLLLGVLAAAGLPLPCRQRMIGGTLAPIGRFDFYYPEFRLVLECDSEAHHSGWAQQERDRERDFKLAPLGIHVLRPTWRLLTQKPQLVVDAVRSRLLLAGMVA